MQHLHGDELAFLAEIFAHPEDETVRCVYADWLEEHGDPRAEILRVESQLVDAEPHSETFRDLQARLRVLRRGVNHNWIAVVTRAAIERCDPQPGLECPKRWEYLDATQFPDIRMCWQCHQEVHYCRTMREARQDASMQRPFAVSLTLNRTPGDISRP